MTIQRQIGCLPLNKFTSNYQCSKLNLYNLNFIVLNKVQCENHNMSNDGYFAYLQPNNLSCNISSEYKRRLWLGGTVETFFSPSNVNQYVNMHSFTLTETLSNVKKLKQDCIVTYKREITANTCKNILLRETRQLFYTNELFHQRAGNKLDFISFTHDKNSKVFCFNEENIIEFSNITANPHFIHLDKKYNKNIEGYPEVLVVQGPNMITESIKYLQEALNQFHFAKINYRIKQNLFENEAG
ncbi:hypothetical protein QEN19_001204 [Hanseniaspora menglaensis]